MRIKKLMALLLAATVSAGCLAGCGQEASNNEAESSKQESKVEATSGEKESDSKEETPLYNVGTLPIVNEPVTLKVLTLDDPAYAWDSAGESRYWDFLEEKTGIHFEVESYSSEEMKTKLPLIMSTPDDMPDLFLRCNIASADVMAYGQNGQLLVLDDYIEQYGTNLNSIFEELDYAYGASAAADGHIYALPAFNGRVSAMYYGMNQIWLDKLGKEVPATIEELYEVFKAIKADGDANGDGIQGNEICWSDTYFDFKVSALSMAGLNVFWPWQGCTFDAVDDEVFFVPTSERYKALVEWLHTFYEEGMLDEEIFTHSTDELVVKVNDGRVFLGRINECDPEAANFNGVEGAFFPETPIVFEAGDEPILTISAPYSTDIGAISAYTEYPEVCMLVLDYMYSEEASLMAGYGEEGVDYNVVSEEPWIVKSAIDGYNLQYGYTPMLVPRWVRDEWIQPSATEMYADRDATRSVYGKMGFQNYLTFTEEESETMSIISADLGIFCDDYFVGFITGEYDIETEWDAYVKECNSMKAEELTAVYQAAYNRYYRVGE